MDKNLAYWFASFNKQENGSLHPSPLVPSCCRHNWHGTLWHALLSWPCKMSLLLLKKPHGGPITHSSTGSKPDPPVPPFPKSILTLGFVCNSGATFLVIYSGNRCNIQSRCFGPLSHVVSDIEHLPICLKLLMVPSYFTLDIFLSIYSRVTPMFILGIPPRWFSFITFYRCRANPLPFS